MTAVPLTIVKAIQNVAGTFGVAKAPNQINMESINVNQVDLSRRTKTIELDLDLPGPNLDTVPKAREKSVRILQQKVEQGVGKDF